MGAEGSGLVQRGAEVCVHASALPLGGEQRSGGAGSTQRSGHEHETRNSEPPRRARGSPTSALLVTCFASAANFRVESVSDACSSASVTVHTSAVRALPPSAGWRILVSGESRYGMCAPASAPAVVSFEMTTDR